MASGPGVGGPGTGGQSSHAGAETTKHMASAVDRDLEQHHLCMI